MRKKHKNIYKYAKLGGSKLKYTGRITKHGKKKRKAKRHSKKWSLL